MLKDRATASGTAAYASRFSRLPGNYRQALGLSFSSLGIGTYLGEDNAATDIAYEDAIRASILSGINVIDTAANYRNQRSERVIGKVIAGLVANGELQRQDVIIATKGGYIAFDGEVPSDPRLWFEQNFIRTGIISPGDVVQGSHCMTPRYLEAMIEQSRENLGLETLDIYYLHNPETQLSAVNRTEFLARIRSAFEFLENAASAGKISVYGVATWNGFRVARNDRSYLSLNELLATATEAGGPDHHFRVIQLPYNLAMTEALTLRNQSTEEGSDNVSLLAAADASKIAVCASASLLQGQLTSRLPEVLQTAFPAMESDAQRSLQFVRSTPGISTALVGMSSLAHVSQNIATATHPPAPFEALMKLYKAAD